MEIMFPLMFSCAFREKKIAGNKERIFRYFIRSFHIINEHKILFFTKYILLQGKFFPLPDISFSRQIHQFCCLSIGSDVSLNYLFTVHLSILLQHLLNCFKTFLLHYIRTTITMCVVKRKSIYLNWITKKLCFCMTFSV